MDFEDWWEEYVDLMSDDIEAPHMRQMKDIAEDVWKAAQESSLAQISKLEVLCASAVGSMDYSYSETAQLVSDEWDEYKKRRKK